MKKTVLALVLPIMFLLTLGLGIANRACANTVETIRGLPSITIESDGSIVPYTELIRKVGNVYTLTEDLAQSYVIVIKSNNIIFDGQGHIINGSRQDKSMKDPHTSGYNSIGITLEKVTNVTIKKVTISGFIKYESVYLYDCSWITILGLQTSLVRVQESSRIAVSNSDIKLSLEDSRNSIVTENNVFLGLSVNSSGNTFYKNNILGVDYGVHYIQEPGFCPLSFWDNGSVGNYWSDYSSKYPNASEISNSGISDTPYVIDASTNNKDNYPLMQPVIIPEIALPTGLPTSLSTSTPASTTPSTPSLAGFDYWSTPTLLALVVIVIVLVVSVILMVHRRHQEKN